MRKIGYIFCVLMLTTQACQKETVNTIKDDTLKGSFSLSVLSPANHPSGRLAAAKSAPASVILSIKDTEGHTVIEAEKRKLIQVGQGYLTEEIALDEGEYTIVDFIVLDSLDNVIYVTPKAASELAALVKHPLPVPFGVFPQATSEVVLEVVPATLDDAGQYGYAVLSFDIVNTLDRGLVGFYPFDGNVNDKSEYANHAVDYTEGAYVRGVKGKALNFDGIDDYLTLENTLDPSQGFSFSFWVSSKGSNGTENNGAIISKYHFHRRSFYINTWGYLDRRNINKIHASFFQADGANTERDWVESNLSKDYLRESGKDVTLWDIVSPDTITLNEWMHVVVNVDDRELSLYLDGELKVKKRREHAAYFNSSEKTYIGNIFNGGEGNNNHFRGYLDELRIYNRKLYHQEIEALYLD